jgi:hypothetical protein
MLCPTIVISNFRATKPSNSQDYNTSLILHSISMQYDVEDDMVSMLTPSVCTRWCGSIVAIIVALTWPLDYREIEPPKL